MLGYGHRKTLTTKGKANHCLLVLCTDLNAHITKMARANSASSFDFVCERNYGVLFASRSSVLKFWHHVQRIRRTKDEGPRGAPKKAIKFLVGARTPWMVPKCPVGKAALTSVGIDLEGRNNYNHILTKSVRVVGCWLTRLFNVLSRHGRFDLLEVLFEPSRTSCDISSALHDSHCYGQYFASATNVGIVIREVRRVLDSWNCAPSIFLEPSCGDGRILHAAMKAFCKPEAKTESRKTHAFVGVDLDTTCITRCRQLFATRSHQPTFLAHDYLTLSRTALLSSLGGEDDDTRPVIVLGGPPYTLHHDADAGHSVGQLAANTTNNVESTSSSKPTESHDPTPIEATESLNSTAIKAMIQPNPIDAPESTTKALKSKSEPTLTPSHTRTPSLSRTLPIDFIHHSITALNASAVIFILPKRLSRLTPQAMANLAPSIAARWQVRCLTSERDGVDNKFDTPGVPSGCDDSHDVSPRVVKQPTCIQIWTRRSVVKNDTNE